MSMINWAKEEVRLACEYERKASGVEDDNCDYGCAYYESALKAFESLCEDEHSGYSIGITKHILNRLIDGKVLRPIEDTDGIWSEPSRYNDDYATYQCKRMSSFFKNVYDDGTVKYRDNDRLICVDIHDHDNCWHNGFVSNIYHEMFPITMPYMPPDRPAKIYCEEFLTDKKNGDFDTMGIRYGENPDGSKFDIHRFFKESKDGWDEITYDEYLDRKTLAKNLKGE